MNGGLRQAGRAVALLALLQACAIAAAAAAQLGPRGPAGPDVPIGEAEQDRLARRIAAEGLTAAAIQAACDRAARERITTVFLPAGEYVMDAQVRVPGGLTLLGEGSTTVLRARTKGTQLLTVVGDDVRITRLKLQGADTTTSAENNSFGIVASGKRNIRVDHCELLGFSYATTFSNEAAGQLDHCSIHHNLRDGLGYGVVVISGAHVLVCDNEFAQNRHSLASNGDLDWGSGKRLGRYVHKEGLRKTHWEFIHNRVGSNDQSTLELTAVDTHPGMDGTFVVEANVFDGVRHGVGIRDGSGIIRGNVFRNLRSKASRPLIAVYIGHGAHNGIPVEGCMPNNIQVGPNVFEMDPGVKYERCSLGKAENITVDGSLVPETRTGRPAPTMPRLAPMAAKDAAPR